METSVYALNLSFLHYITYVDKFNSILDITKSLPKFGALWDLKNSHLISLCIKLKKNNFQYTWQQRKWVTGECYLKLISTIWLSFISIYVNEKEQDEICVKYR